MTDDTKNLKWIKNIYDPGRPDAQQVHLSRYGQGLKEDWSDYLKWVAQFRKGPPKATDRYSEQQLTDMGMIGLYKTDESHRMTNQELYKYRTQPQMDKDLTDLLEAWEREGREYRRTAGKELDLCMLRSKLLGAYRVAAIMGRAIFAVKILDTYERLCYSPPDLPEE